LLELLRARVGVDGLEHPGLLAAMLVLAVVALVASLRRAAPAFAWPALEEIRAAGGRRHDPLGALARVLRLLALVALALVLAGPVSKHPREPATSEGLDVVLVLDTSTSMRALDAEVEGEWRTRLDLALRVVKRFALHRVADGDRIGLVAFGERAFTHCPLTRDGRLLEAALARVEPGMAGESTALGDALALAVKRVDPGGEGVSAPAAGRVVVLLTDGRSNAGSIPTDVAAALAATRGVRVHTVGIGSSGAVPIAGDEGAARRGLRFERHDLDAATLERIAATSGGRYFHARSPQHLEAVYAEIDTLERVPREWGSEAFEREERPEPFLMLAGAMLLGELATTRLARRRLP
jgi:Ca-activated chloride channel family protein